MSSGISIQCSNTSRYFVVSSLLYICIVRQAKYVTIIPIAERGERATARLTRDTRRRSPMDCFFAPPRRKRFIFFAPSERERDSKDENGTSCSSVHPSHSVLRPERRAEPQNAVRRTRRRAQANRLSKEAFWVQILHPRKNRFRR